MQTCPSALQELGRSKVHARRPGFVGDGSSEPGSPALFGSERRQSLHRPISPRFKLPVVVPRVRASDGVSTPFDEPRAGRGHRGGLTGYQCRIYAWKSTAPRRGTPAGVTARWDSGRSTAYLRPTVVLEVGFDFARVDPRKNRPRLFRRALQWIAASREARGRPRGLVRRGGG